METTKIFVLSMLCIASLLFTGCSDDDDVMGGPVSLPTQVLFVDSEGNNLLNDSTIDAVRENVSINQRGEFYYIDQPYSIVAPYRIFESTRHDNGEYSVRWIVAVGINVKDVEYIIDYGNGLQDKLEYTVKFYGGAFNGQVKLNGEVIPDAIFNTYGHEICIKVKTDKMTFLESNE